MFFPIRRLKSFFAAASLLSLFTILFLLHVGTVSAQVRRDRTKPAEQTLTGSTAVESLKQSGQYDSLMSAVARASRGDTEHLLPNGQYEEVTLTASDGAAGDLFGIDFVISGDTVVVSSPEASVGGNPPQGTLYVFRRSGSSWTQEAKLTPSGATESFGAIALSGDTLLIGSPNADSTANDYQGAAYVYKRTGTSWAREARLTPADSSFYDFFGFAVSIDGDTAVIGASGAQVGSEPLQGAAYVFTRSGTTWTQQAKLAASDAQAFDFSGSWVAVQGDTAFFANPTETISGNFRQGAVYVFTRSGATWTQATKLIAADGDAGDEFGTKFSVSGNTLVVSSPLHDVGTSVDQGAVYVFTGSGVTWTQQAKITSSDGVESDEFGWGVAISGDTLIVSVVKGDVGSNLYQGKAYKFQRSGSTWTQTDIFTDAGGDEMDYFGRVVAISGDTAVFGVRGDDIGANTDQGSVRILQTKIIDSKNVAPDGADTDGLGYSVAINGNTAVVGAPLASPGGVFFQGAAYVFTHTAGIWTLQQKLTAADGAPFDYFGYSVSVFGDSVLVGAPAKSENGNSEQGAVYVFIRSGTSWTQQQKILAADGSFGDSFGYGVSIEGDTALIGAPFSSPGGLSARGSAYVYTRSGGAWTPQQKLLASDGLSIDRFGYSVSLSGNTAVIGANGDTRGANNSQGSAYVFVRSGTVWSEQANIAATDGGTGDQFGYSVSISEDTILVGAPYWDASPGGDQGAAYVFIRSGTAWSAQQKLTPFDAAADDQFGYGVSISGNTLIVGAPYKVVGGNSNRGSAYIYSRSGANWSLQRKLLASDGAEGDNFGYDVAVSGTGAVVGANADDIGANTDQGSSYMYFWGALAPTSAGSRLAGRVLEPSGRGLRNATVVLTDSSGNTRTAQTGTFGNFSFSDLPSGETYILSVNSRRFVFAPEAFSLQSDLDGLVIRATGTAAGAAGRR